jgi:hypothetical protein
MDRSRRRPTRSAGKVLEFPGVFALTMRRWRDRLLSYLRFGRVRRRRHSSRFAYKPGIGLPSWKAPKRSRLRSTDRA